MPTQAQIRANRENAKKSTGPRTPEGKARTAKNALKHGLLAEDAVIPGEDPAKFDRHLTNIENTYLPRNYVEKQIVNQIADTMWRIKRLSRIETTVVSASIERTRVYQHDFRVERIRQGHEGDLQLLGESMFCGTKFLNNLARYDGHLRRCLHRDLELMMKIRREERKSRQAGPSPHPDDGFDIYDSTDDDASTGKMEQDLSSAPTVGQVSRPAQAQPQKPQTPSNQSSSIGRRTKKQRNKPKRTTQETRQSREAIRDLRRRLGQLAALGGDLQP